VEKPPWGFWMFVWEAMKETTLMILAICAVISLFFHIFKERWPKGAYAGLGVVFSILLVVSVTETCDYHQSLQFKDLDREKKKISIQGMQNGQKITFQGEADEAPDTVTGDIVFVVQQKDHPKFKRKGDDLFVEHTLLLTEALCGFQFILTHLDGRQLLINYSLGEVVKPGQFKEINDEGNIVNKVEDPFVGLAIHTEGDEGSDSTNNFFQGWCLVTVVRWRMLIQEHQTRKMVVSLVILLKI
jgi:hypothetical protein